MSKALIENYRGFEIYFDTYYEKFQTIITEDDSKESASYAAVKRFIDDFKNNNQNFNSFWIQSIPTAYLNDNNKVKVIGLRKDNRFVFEGKNGDKNQISEYDEKAWMIFKDENTAIIEKIINYRKEQLNISNQYKEKIIDEIAKLEIIPLNEFKKRIIL